MIRTKPAKPRRTKWPADDQWWIGMEFMPGQFGLVTGPFRTMHDVLAQNPDHHHCIVYIRGKDDKVFLTHRKNSGVWKAVKKQQILLGPRPKQRPKRTKSRLKR